MLVYRELAALVFEEAPNNLDAVAQAARLCDSIHVFRLRYGSDYLLVQAATHIHNDFPKRGWGSTIRDRLCGYW